MRALALVRPAVGFPSRPRGLDAAGTDGGVACTGGSLVSARFVTPAGGAFGAGGVVDASGAGGTACGG